MTSTMDPRTLTPGATPGATTGTPITSTTMSPQLQAMFARFEREFDDPEYRGRHEPLVRQFDAPLRDGRRPVDRRRRLAGGLIDLVTAVVPLAVAARAGVNPVLLIVAHLLVTVVPTTMFGFTLGKWMTGTRVVDPSTLGSPTPGRALVRWLLSFGPTAAVFAHGMPADGAVLLTGAIYFMIAVDLRGLHARAGRTVVVGRRSGR